MECALEVSSALYHRGASRAVDAGGIAAFVRLFCLAISIFDRRGSEPTAFVQHGPQQHFFQVGPRPNGGRAIEYASIE
jgi:hypothetical protein